MAGRLDAIARRAGVSAATVSRVLNDKPGVAEHTRRLVVSAMDLLGYERPDALRTKDTGLVGIIVPELDNPIFPRLARAVQIGLVRRRYTPVLCSHTPGGVHEDDYVRAMVSHGVSGLVFVSGIHALEGADRRRYQGLVDRRLPFVLMNGALPGLSAPCISFDDAVAVDKAVAHLAQLGHVRIGLALGEERYQPVVRRRHGFAVAMRAHVDPELTDAAIETLVDCTAFTVEGGQAAADTLLDRGVTAVVCGSDLMAIGVLEAARRRGLEVPADLSVVGSDDSDLIPYLSPALTTLRQPAEAMGAAAASILVELMRGAPSMASSLLFPPDLVVRASTARPTLTGTNRTGLATPATASTPDRTS